RGSWRRRRWPRVRRLSRFRPATLTSAGITGPCPRVAAPTVGGPFAGIRRRPPIAPAVGTRISWGRIREDTIAHAIVDACVVTGGIGPADGVALHVGIARQAQDVVTPTLEPVVGAGELAQQRVQVAGVEVSQPAHDIATLTGEAEAGGHDAVAV